MELDVLHVERLEVLASALALLVADNQSINAFYPDDVDWIAIKVNKNKFTIFIKFYGIFLILLYFKIGYALTS